MTGFDFTPSARFQVIRCLGEGAMGVVCEATDLQDNRRVALKTMRAPTPEALVRFKREFRSMQNVNHQNLVTLGELFCDNGQWYFSMELVEGKDFIEYVRGANTSGNHVETGSSQVSFITNPTRPSSDSSRDEASGDGLVTEKQTLDEGRLRRCLVQLALGLEALHAAGNVHRDVKPGNIRVTPEGRLVLLDFGLVAEEESDELSVGCKVGTALYMAPEQALGRPPGPAADWYSVGAVLYKALTGHPPYAHGVAEALMQASALPDPRTEASGVPEDLATLCMRLLRIEPEERPSGPEIVKAVNATTSLIPSARADAPKRRSLRAGSRRQLFVGRAHELEILRDAFERSAGQAVAVLVEGESGLGKTALMKHFLDAQRDVHRDLIILAGKCRERESVPYKAVDGVVDALAGFMARLPHADAMGLLPHRANLLARVFPVLRRVPAISQVPVMAHNAPDPIELRGRVFGAMRELFDRIVQRWRVIVTIDDLQWADADSLALITDLLRPPEEPRLQLIATVRATAGHDAVSALCLSCPTVRIPLAGLPQEEALELASRLREHVAPSQQLDAATIVREAGGHPMFIDELVRHVATGGSPSGAMVRLDEALWGRVSQLEPQIRKTLELIVVMGSPITLATMANALGDTGENVSGYVSALRHAHLVRTSKGGRTDLIEPYHDRVREAVFANLDSETKQRHHRALALACETAKHPDAEALATHWHGAGDAKRAARYAQQAADSATETLAFEHAARLYRMAIELSDAAGEDGARLWTRLAQALENGGRGVESANAYRTAATWLPEGEARTLKQKGAEQLLRAGHIDAGLAEAHSVLVQVGMPLPASPLRAFLSLAWRRVIIKFRGLGFARKTAGDISPNTLRVIDLCWSLSMTLGMVDSVRGNEFQSRHLLLALRVGEPYRVVRALALEIPYAATFASKGWDAVESLYERAKSLARSVDDPHGAAVVAMGAGIAAYLLGNFQKSLERCEEAEQALRNCTGTWSEIARSRTFGLKSLAMTGSLKELCRRTPIVLREAIERNDNYAATIFRTGHPNLMWLVLDDPERARTETVDAIAQWTKRGFHLEHYYGLLSLVQTDLYAGNAERAWTTVEQQWAALERSFLLRVPVVRRQGLFFRGRAALALAEASTGSRRGAMLAEVRRIARKLQNEGASWCAPMGVVLAAGLDNVEGRLDPAVHRLEQAIAGFEQGGMLLHAAASRRAWGNLVGGDEGRAAVQTVRQWMASEGVVQESSLARTMVPGFARLS